MAKDPSNRDVYKDTGAQVEIAIDRASSTPLYRQIAARFQHLIETGAVPAGYRLPPERRLASALGVNRTTILNAYAELKALALVDAKVGRGTEVLPRLSEESVLGQRQPLHYQQLFAERVDRIDDPLIRDLLQLTEQPDVISLAAGLPSESQLPLDLVQDVFAEICGDVGPALLQYTPTEGLSTLRQSLSRWAVTRGMPTRASEVLVLSGSQQGLDLVARVFLEPGDTVVVEEPSFIGALQVFQASQVRLIGVPVDSQGMRTDILESVLARYRPKLIYTLPTFQNPSGGVLSYERRNHLLQLAYRHNVLILEDDPYSELRYDGPSIPSLKALDQEGYVLYLSTLSKVLFPGLRQAFMVAPKPVIHQLALAKQTVDIHTNTLGQHLLQNFLDSDRYNIHLQKVRNAYRLRRDAMSQALLRDPVPGLEFQAPLGGFYFWCRLPQNVDPSLLMARAAGHGVAYLPGSACFFRRPDDNYVRLSFSLPDVEQIKEGVVRFATAMKEATRARFRNSEMLATQPMV